MRRWLFILAIGMRFFTAGNACALSGDIITFRGHSYVTAVVDLREDNLRLFWKDASGAPFTTLGALSHNLQHNGETMLFATNSGIYDKHFSPLGLHIERGRALSALNLKSGGGNFFIKPNGVFFIDEHGHAAIVSSPEFHANSAIRYAAQSGPLLLQDGMMNPRFHVASENRKLRSGAGIMDGNKVVFAISQDDVTFYEFASLFGENFHCRDALYLDGTISRMFLLSTHEDKGGPSSGYGRFPRQKPFTKKGI